MSTRIMVLTSWHNARRQSAITGTVTLTAASFAGYVLEAAEGDAEAARKLVPHEQEAIWARVLDALAQVETDERADTERPMALAGARR